MGVDNLEIKGKKTGSGGGCTYYTKGYVVKVNT
jgi:hypothetical protein